MKQRPFEHMLLDYLEGRLNPSDEAAFLRLVARDPEKEALLSQHRKLHAILEKQRKSYPPARTEQSLARRIPVLSFVPPVSKVAHARNHGNAADASRSSLRRRLIGGAGLLLAIALFVQIGNSILQDGVIQREGAAEYATNRVGAERQGPVKEDPGAVADPGAVSGPGAMSAPGAVSVGGEQQDSAYISDAAVQNLEDSDAGRGEPSSYTRRSSGDQNATGAQLPNPAAARADHGRRPEPLEPRHGGKGSEDLPVSPYPIQQPFPAGRISASTGAVGPPVMVVRHAVARHPWDFGGRLHAFVETGAGFHAVQRSDRSLQNDFGQMYDAGLRLELAPAFAVGITVGSSGFTRETLGLLQSTLTDNDGVAVVVMNNGYERSVRQWVRGHAYYVLNPEDMLQFEVTAGTGLLFAGELDVMFSTGLSAFHPVGNGMYLQAGLHYSGAWLSARQDAPAFPQQGVEPIGVIWNAQHAGRTFNSSIQLRVGAGVQLW